MAAAFPDGWAYPHWGGPDPIRLSLTPAGEVKPKMTLEAYERPADPPELKLCRPCSTSDRGKSPYHPCDGPPCECALCRRDELGFRDVVEDMELDWRRRDKEDSWPG